MRRNEEDSVLKRLGQQQCYNMWYSYFKTFSTFDIRGMSLTDRSRTAECETSYYDVKLIKPLIVTIRRVRFNVY
jgi:hypothetical protein